MKLPEVAVAGKLTWEQAAHILKLCSNGVSVETRSGRIAHFFICGPRFVMPSTVQLALTQRLMEFGERAAAESGVELVEVELRGAGKARLLRVYIDKPGGVTHADCEAVSQRLGKLLDDEDVIPDDSYTLEVSSPGVDRKLVRPRDFDRVVGQKVKIALKEPVEGFSRVEGKLSGVEGDTLAVEIESGQLLRVRLDQVRKANLKFEW